MLDSAHTLIKRVGDGLGLKQDQIDELLSVDASHHFTINLNNGKSYPAFRVQHNSKLGPYKGGIRFHPEVDIEEVTALATLMSLKTSAVGLPLGGGKGGIRVDPKALTSDEIEELSREYVRGLHGKIGPDKDIPAPDVNTNSQIIDWMVDEFEKISGDEDKASFTGKSLNNGGSLGREAATGRGGVMALAEFLSISKWKDTEVSYALQGFGNVGAYFAKVASKDYPSWKLVAASDSKSGIKSNNLNAKLLFNYKAKKNNFNNLNIEGADHITNEQLLTSEVDVLVLAALGDAINESNMKNVRSKIIIELANGPVNEKAHEYLTSKGVIVIPDIIANSGGVIVSYLEWLQNTTRESWTENKVNSKLMKYMKTAMQNVYKLSKKENLSLKEAAFQIAIKRLLI